MRVNFIDIVQRCARQRQQILLHRQAAGFADHEPVLQQQVITCPTEPAREFSTGRTAKSHSPWLTFSKASSQLWTKIRSPSRKHTPGGPHRRRRRERPGRPPLAGKGKRFPAVETVWIQFPSKPFHNLCWRPSGFDRPGASRGIFLLLRFANLLQHPAFPVGDRIWKPSCFFDFGYLGYQIHPARKQAA